MGITKLVSPLFSARTKKIELYANNARELQEEVLRSLLSKAENTEYFKLYGLQNTVKYEDFLSRCPLNTYDDLKAYIERMRQGETNILCRGKVKWYAKSSGTTSDKSKFIPVSSEVLHDTHYQGGKDTVALYIRNNPKSRIFDGRSLILGGSHSPNYNVAGSLVGDLSAILIENISPLVNLVRVPNKQTALLLDFEKKRERLAREVLNKRITNISGVPSWMLSVLLRVVELSGKKNLTEVWPELEVFFHGGIAFTPYREQYERLIPTTHMHYMETYNASEGFFAIQDDPSDSSMLLMIDYGVFYEFIPMDEFGSEKPVILPLWEVETGRNYAMVITTSGGLWRYVIGDTVMFTSRNPYKIKITGRTKYFINAFGEELIQDNAEKGLKHACEKCDAEILEYTAAPVFMDEEGHCRHQWLIEFSREPKDLAGFTFELDAELQRLNSDYEAKRYKDITLQMPQVIKAREGQFTAWLKSKGKLGGQNKVPRLSNERDIIDQLLDF